MKRLILFDVDGTLVSGGPAKEAFHEALLEVFGTAGPIREWEFSGKTDPQIARELLQAAGLDEGRINRGFPELFDRYLGKLEARLPENPTRLLAGVASLLEELTEMAARRELGLGLVTGNLSRGADLKLVAAGIRTEFPVGAYGSDHEIRNELPGIALKRAREHWGLPVRPEQAVVVGDTPRDVECGRHHGTRTVAVATGRFNAVELEATGADVVLEDLSDGERVLAALLG
jgi:phosphoglycolate phosphatase